jgi:protein-S-isoprenylcysteine O-methyltransferase Ste14
MNPILRRIFQLLFLVILQGALLFLSAGKFTWAPGWLYLGLYLIGLMLASVIMLPRRKEVIEERSRGAAGGRTWDIWLTRVMTIPSLGLLVVAGLDERFGWRPDFSLIFQVLGCVFFLLGYAVIIWAMYTNRFFSSVVRIQVEREHVAVTGGPYRFVRHPGYVGMMTSSLGGVLLLRSTWAIIPFVLYVAIVIARTAMEDKTLQAELPGYAAYASHTRSRLFPGIW